MSERLTRAAARNIFYGGSAFFFVAFGALTLMSHRYIVNQETANPVSDGVARGKQVWERNACIDCHSILGEGAYFAPELGNVWKRWGGDKDPAGARETFKAWMAAQPSGIQGRRQMPQFHLSEPELNDLADFLRWTSKVDTQGWPPNQAG